MGEFEDKTAHMTMETLRDRSSSSSLHVDFLSVNIVFQFVTTVRHCTDTENMAD